MKDNELFNTKMSRCRYHLPGLENSWCIKHDAETNCEACDRCADFNSLFIEYPIMVNKVHVEDFNDPNGLYKNKIGALVEIRPCDKECNEKTYVGVLLGELPMCANIQYNKKDKTLSVVPHFNPAIFVPELKKIVFGAESWWRIINNADELKEISDEDINNTWYVQMMKAMYASNDENTKTLQEKSILE